MQAESTKWVFAYGALLLQIVIFVALIRRKLHSEFPLFSGYIGFNIASTFVVLASWTWLRSYELYFYAFWITSPFIALLGLAMIHELYFHALRPYPGLASSAASVFRLTMLVMLGIAALATMIDSQSESAPLIAALVAFSSSVRIVQAGLILTLLVLVRSLGLLWQGFSVWIATGYGLFAAATAMAGILRLYYGMAADTALSMMVPAAYFAATAIWMVGALRASVREENYVSIPLNQLEMQAWNHSIPQALLRRT